MKRFLKYEDYYKIRDVLFKKGKYQFLLYLDLITISGYKSREIKELTFEDLMNIQNTWKENGNNNQSTVIDRVVERLSPERMDSLVFIGRKGNISMSAQTLNVRLKKAVAEAEVDLGRPIIMRDFLYLHARIAITASGFKQSEIRKQRERLTRESVSALMEYIGLEVPEHINFRKDLELELEYYRNREKNLWNLLASQGNNPQNLKDYYWAVSQCYNV